MTITREELNARLGSATVLAAPPTPSGTCRGPSPWRTRAGAGLPVESSL
ncbi:hypothetical protein [Nonomuraea sp. NPDC052265]